MRVSFLLLAANLLSIFPSISHAEAGTTTFTNTRRLLFDVDGNQIDGVNSKINFFNGTYYLYGNSFANTGSADGIKAYFSNDLITWQYQGVIYDDTVKNPCSGSGISCSRPHIMYNEKTQKYVMWANAPSEGYVVATSSSPASNFEFAPTSVAVDPQFAGLIMADFAVENFGDEAYLVFSALNFSSTAKGSLWPALTQTLHITPLTDDFLNTTLVSYNVTSADFDDLDQQTESPEIFQRDGTFYIGAGNTCGYCNGTIGLMYRSATIQGPWTRDIIAENSCNGQLEGILPLPHPTNPNETTYLWHVNTLPGGLRTAWGGHIFQPLQFSDDGGVQPLNCDDSAKFPVQLNLGTGPVPSGNEVGPNRTSIGSPPDATYAPICDTDQFQVFQTWVQPASGTITGLSINVARASQTAPLMVEVFKFSNIADLESYGYNYQSLGTSNINATELSYTFATTFVPLSANVEAGDHLGFSLRGPDMAPYCYLQYDVGDAEYGNVLLQQGLGQNSFRGMNGKESVVYERTGKGIKFFVNMK